LSTTLSTGMTGISLHMQWPLTSQSHSSILKENNCLFFHYGSNSMPSSCISCFCSRWQFLHNYFYVTELKQ
jgi:hypothetical protein